MSKNTEKPKHALPAEKQQSSTKGNNPDESLSESELDVVNGGEGLSDPLELPHTHVDGTVEEI